MEEISSGDARKLYELVCEEFSIKTRSYTTFWKHLKSLETEGLLKQGRPIPLLEGAELLTLL